jgi:hypothetical protein
MTKEDTTKEAIKISEKFDNIRITMAENFGVTKTELVNIKDHLSILNGRVGVVEVKITDVVIKATAQSGKLENVSTWRAWILPIMASLVTGLIVFIVTK